MLAVLLKTYINRYLAHLLHYLDLVVLGFSLVFGSIFILLYLLIIPNIYLPAVGSAIIIGSIVYVLLYEKGFQQRSVIHFDNWKWFDITVVVLLTLVALNLHITSERTFAVFFLFALLSGTIGVSIFLDSDNEHNVRNILYILALSLVIISSIYYTQLSLTGVDAGIHAAMNEKLAESGSIEVLEYQEKYFPIMHASVAILMIIATISIKETTLFSVVFPLIISTVSVYLIGNTIFSDRRIGLFALLFLNVSDWFIFWGYSPTTTTYGVLLYFFIVYVLFKYLYYPDVRWAIILIISVATMIFTHAMSSFILVFTFISISFICLMGRYLLKETIWVKSMNTLIMITIFSAIIMIFHWFNALYLSDPFFDTLIRMLLSTMDSQFGAASRPETIASIQVTLPPTIERFADVGGLISLLILFTVGLLYSLSKKYRSLPKYLLGSVAVILFSVIFGTPFFGLRNLIPDRWFVFAYLFVSLTSAYALVSVIYYLPKAKLKLVGIFVIIATMTFLFTASTICNQDSPLWLKESTRPYSLAPLSVSEDMGYKTITKHTNEVMDNRVAISEEDIFNRGNTPFIWKKYMLDRPVRLFRDMDETTSMEYDMTRYFNKVLGKEYYEKLLLENKIYSNGDIIAFLPRG